MSIKSLAAKLFAAFIEHRNKNWIENPIEAQEKVFQNLIDSAADTAFGQDHEFGKIKTYDDFKNLVPLRDYEDLKPYVNRVKAGEANVLWKGKPIYFSKTSGTTSGTKYIPITKESIHNHIDSARNALLSYISETGDASFVKGRMIFLSGSPVLSEISGIPTGRLSGIVNHHVPAYLRSNQLPTYETNCIEDWETKVDAIVEETANQNMTLISGIPSWVQMYFEKLQKKTGKKILDLFPEFSLFVYGGVNFEPYRQKFENMMGGKVASIQLYPASEGFMAYQDKQDVEGMLLLVDSGIFFEFVRPEQCSKPNPERLSLKDVELGINYAIVLNTNAGLWSYLIGDTVKFVSKSPYRIIVSGRVKHFTSAFGEHVIAEEVEYALQAALAEMPVEVTEFHVAPQVAPTEGLPYHEWFIEFAREPDDLQAFALLADKALQRKNSYYSDLLEGNILRPLVIRKLEKDAFVKFMKGEGKLGGQNKTPRLSNDRSVADKLMGFCV